MNRKRTMQPELSTEELSGKNPGASVRPASLNAPSDGWLTMMAEQTAAALWMFGKDEATIKKQQEAICDALLNVDPKDEIEAMMVSQMIAAHSAVMECYRRAMIPEQNMQSREDNLNHAGKMMRAFASLVETFNRHRGKNHQKVEVRHVHVHDGGQAVVGMVTRGGGG